jgi:hypothetical protein
MGSDNITRKGGGAGVGGEPSPSLRAADTKILLINFFALHRDSLGALQFEINQADR